ncbi:hypothetical protein JOE61_001539 [Nocardioides salarius]|uniref:DUF3352 domain-containing protein n=1 Tax=Nocardioides salarius TaxID=374513 RepID=A0ABS2M985_9ACTN|nr:hypothetical protein [Nocardioides salarius]MBM7507725.1 hypothetical protein [Nocardioides salarius]
MPEPSISAHPQDRRTLRRGLVVAGVVALTLLLIAVLAVGVRWWRGPGSDLERAVSLAPADTQRWTWTDWAAVRERLGVTGTDDDAVRRLLDAGFDADLTSASGLVESAPLLAQSFGWSPASIDWELLAQSPDGALEIVGLGDDADASALGDRLESLGYTRPDSPEGVWEGGEEVLARLNAASGSAGTPTLQFVALDEERSLLLASDQRAYLERSLEEAADEHEPSAAGVTDVLGTLPAQPLSAVLLTGEQACGSLSMGGAGDSDQAAADELLAQAGPVSPLTGFVLALLPPEEDGDGGSQAPLDLRVGLGFESEEQARTNADTRAALAAGPAPGQGGAFSDRFTVDEVTADATTVTLDLAPVAGAFPLSDLSDGPLLFATC